MTLQKPFHRSSRGGSIACLQGMTGRIFRTCVENNCTYTADLHTAKAHLDLLENKKVHLLSSSREKESVPDQRKTTLKWDADGCLSSVDMVRILNRLEKTSLTECELSCEWSTNSEH